MIRNITLLFLSLFMYLESAAADSRFVCPAGGYVQRVVLTYDGAQTPLTVYVKNSGDDSLRVVVDSPAGWLAKITLDSLGNEVSLKTSEFFPERLARKFILRDIRAVLGYIGLLDDGVVKISTNNLGLVATLCTDNYSAIFSEYCQDSISKGYYPRSIEIVASSYKLNITTASIKN